MFRFPNKGENYCIRHSAMLLPHHVNFQRRGTADVLLQLGLSLGSIPSPNNQ
jgi:hypothetical protein